MVKNIFYIYPQIPHNHKNLQEYQHCEHHKWKHERINTNFAPDYHSKHHNDIDSSSTEYSEIPE